MARVIQKAIKTPLADEVLFGKLKNGGAVRVVVVADEAGTKTLDFVYPEGPVPAAARARHRRGRQEARPRSGAGRGRSDWRGRRCRNWGRGRRRAVVRCPERRWLRDVGSKGAVETVGSVRGCRVERRPVSRVGTFMPSQHDVVAAIAGIAGPDGRTPLPQSGALGGVVVREDRVFVSLEVASPEAPGVEPMRASVERVVRGLPGVGNVFVTLTSQSAGGTTPKAPAPAQSNVHTHSHGPAAASPAPRSEGAGGTVGAAGSRRSDHHRGRLGQRRRRQSLRPRPISRWRCATRAAGWRSSMPTSTDPRCRGCSA